MGDIEKVKYLLSEVHSIRQGDDESVEKNNGGVTSIASLRQDLGTNSAETILTSGTSDEKKKKFITDRTVRLTKGKEPAGIIHRINGKPLKITGLSEKEKNEYLYGDTKIEKMVSQAGMIAEYLEALSAPEIEDDLEQVLEKCDKSKSFLIKGKIGKWRRVSGAPVFICKDGTIHAGPRHFVGKNVNTLRDDLRAEKKRTKQGSKK